MTFDVFRNYKTKEDWQKLLNKCESFCKQCIDKGDNYLPDGYCLCGDCCWKHAKKRAESELEKLKVKL